MTGPRQRFDWLTFVGPYLGLAAVVLAFAGLIAWRNPSSSFLTLSNVRLMTLHAAVTAAVAVGMTVIMISGGIDLSVGYVVSLITVVTALAYGRAAALGAAEPLTSAVAVGAGVATGVCAGFVNGAVITRLRIVPFVATLGTMGVARGLSQYLSGGQLVTFPDPVHPPPWVRWLSTIDPKPAWLLVSPSVWGVLVLAVLAAVMLRCTVLGRHCYAIGASEPTARMCGIPVDRRKVLFYSLAGLATGWAGIIQTARSGAGSYNVQAGLELEVIAAVVIGGGSLSGGVGTVSGTIIGAMILAVLDNGCTKLNLGNEFRFIVIGAILIGVAAFNTWRQRRLR